VTKSVVTCKVKHLQKYFRAVDFPRLCCGNKNVVKMFYFTCNHLLSLTCVQHAIGVGDGGRGRRGGSCPQKFGKKYFSGKNHVKFGHLLFFSGIYHVKFGNFIKYSGKYHVKFRHFVNFSCMYFPAKMSCPCAPVI